MPDRSGAASSSAVLMASSRVDEEAGQPSQLPSRRRRTTPSSRRDQLDVAAMRLHVGADLLERLRHPLLHRDRVEVVDQHQARDDAVVGERCFTLGRGATRSVEDLRTILSRPWPYISMTASTRSSAARRATGSGSCWTWAVSSSTRWIRASGLPRLLCRRAWLLLPDPLSTSRSAYGSPCGPDRPGPCTCALRTAGTGRSSAPPA